MEFSKLAARLDALDEIAGEEIGGPTDIQIAAIGSAETAVYAATAVTPTDRAWLAERLARAEANEWTDEAKAPLLAVMERAGMFRRAA